MTIFLTGATGYVGSAIAEALTDAGHEVRALARSKEAEDSIRGRGWTPVPGDLGDAEVLTQAASDSDATIHAAFSQSADGTDLDVAAVRTILHALKGSEKPFVYTSGIWVLGPTDGRIVDESESTENAAPISAFRQNLEKEILDAAGDGTRTVVIRPGVVYGNGEGIVGLLLGGNAPLIDDGTNWWPLVHRDALADLYVHALDAPAGTILHGITEHARPGDLASIARTAFGNASAIQTSDLHTAREQFGQFADALALDQQVSSAQTREITDWRPRHPSVVDEVLDIVAPG